MSTNDTDFKINGSLAYIEVTYVACVHFPRNLFCLTVKIGRSYFMQ
jgi:hypothetical protein